MQGYPKSEAKGFSIVHCNRDGAGIRSVMGAGELSWSPGVGWIDEEIEIPERSGAITSLGSGGKRFEDWNFKFQASDVPGTSRSIFQAFCKMLQNNNGGMRQDRRVTRTRMGRSLDKSPGHPACHGENGLHAGRSTPARGGRQMVELSHGPRTIHYRIHRC